MAVKTKVQLEAENDTNITTNGDNEITGALLNTLITNLIDSLQSQILSYTTDQINALSPTVMDIVYDTTLSEYKFYNGTVWARLSSMFNLGAGALSLIDKRATTSSGANGTSIGSAAVNSGTSAQAIGAGATNSGTQGQAIGNAANNSQSLSQALGYAANCRIANSTNLSGAIIIRKDNGETLSYQYHSGAEVVILSVETDLKTIATITAATLPSGVKMYVNEVGTIMTSANTVTGQATASFGKTSSNAFLLAATATTGLTAAGKRDKQTSILQAEGVTSLVADITAGATGTTALGRFYFKGFIVEDE